MMNRKEFYEYVKDNVKEYLPESYRDAEIKLQEVEKNNGLKLTGITIPNGDQRIVPTVYLDSLYQEYINGKDVDSCVGDVADMRIEAQGKAEFFDMGVPDILDYEKMKDKLQMRICDKEWNTDRLADKVVTEHGDFAAYYAVNLEENGEGISSIPVTVSLMNEWGVSVEQIQADAMMADKNRGVQLVDMTQIIESMIFGGTPKNLLNEKLDMETVENMDIGSYQGFNMRIQFDSWSKEFILSVKHESVAKVRLGADALGNITRINNLLESYPEKLAEAEQRLETVQEQMTNAKEEVGKPFPKEEELNQKLERLSELNALLYMDVREDTETEQSESKEKEERPARGSIHEKLQIYKEKSQRESETGKETRKRDFGLE